MTKRKRRADAETVTFEMVTFHDSILPRPLRFAPPYADLASDPSGFSRFWQFAQFAFDLPDPASIPAFVDRASKDEHERLERFVSSCRELAGYSFMSAHDSISFSAAGGVTTLTTSFSPTEFIRAAIVLFRQLYSGDAGSYGDVVGIVSSHHRQCRDRLRDQRDDVIVPWRRAHGQLMQSPIEVIVDRLVIDRESASGHSELPVPGGDIRPTELISRYMYGDLIHWGDKRCAIARDETQSALDRMKFLQSVSSLAHFYLGFSVLVASAFELDLP